MAGINQKYVPYEAMPSEPEGEVQLYDYMQIVSRYKVLIIAITAAAIALAVLYNQVSPRIYQASMAIIIPPNPKSALLASSQISLPGSITPTEKSFNTEVYKIKSPFVLERAVKILKAKGYFKSVNLSRQDEENTRRVATNGSIQATREAKTSSSTTTLNPGQQAATPGATVTHELGLFQNKNAPLPNAYNNSTSEFAAGQFPNPNMLQLLSVIQHSVSVSAVKNTDVVEISAVSTDPLLARDMANAVADAFAQYDKDFTYQLDVESLRYLTDEIEEVRQSLLKTQIALNEYLALNKILDPVLAQQLYISKHSDLDKTLDELESNRHELEVRVNELSQILEKPIEEVALPEVTSIPAANMPHFAEIRSKLIDAQLQRNALAMRVTPNNQEFKEIESQIIMLNSQLRDEIKKIIKAVEFEIQVIIKKETLMTDFVAALDESFISKGRQSIQYLVLQRDSESYKWLYQYLLGSVMVGEINAKENQMVVQICAYADAPIFPIRPRVILNLILGGMLGLMGGVGLAFVIESLDQTISKPEKIEEFSELPLLSILPHLLPEEVQQRQGLIVEHSPQDHFSEGISRLWGNIRVLMKFKEMKSLIVTSALASEGKTTISANLATMTGNSMQTVLLGCDFRRPSMLGFFNIDKEKAGGLNDSIGLLYQHPSEFAAEELCTGDLHTLIMAQRLSGAIEVHDAGSEPLVFSYQNGILHSSNIANWKQSHPNLLIDKFLEEKAAIFSEIVYDAATAVNQNESEGELSASLDKLPPKKLLSRIIDLYAIKGGSRGLWILESKRISFSPSELIGSPAMKELIRILKLHFDLVIIDTPPSVPFADITSLSGIADNILLVARAGVITQQTIHRCINWLKRLNFTMIGYVFNDTELNRDNYYYYGYYSYKQYRKSGYGKYGSYYYGEKDK